MRSNPAPQYKTIGVTTKTTQNRLRYTFLSQKQVIFEPYSYSFNENFSVTTNFRVKCLSYTFDRLFLAVTSFWIWFKRLSNVKPTERYPST